MKINVYAEAIQRYILYTQRMNIEASLSGFIDLNKNLIAEELAVKERSINEVKSLWGSRFAEVALKRLKRGEFVLDFEKVDWHDLIELGIEKASSTAEQEIRRTRSRATYEAFREETEIVASTIRKRQLEKSPSTSKISRRKIESKDKNGEDDKKKTDPNSSGNCSSKNSSSSDKNKSEDCEVIDVVFDKESLWHSDGSSYVYETHTEPSFQSSAFTKKFIWSLSLCELGLSINEKVEMTTTNTTVKDIYDSAHSDAASGKVKRNDLVTRLHLSGLFDNADTEIQPISVGFVAQLPVFSNLTQQNIDTLVSSLKTDEILRLNNEISNMEELAINHILTDIYFQHSAAKHRPESELSLITKSISCLFGTLWSSRDNIRLIWDTKSLATSTVSPDNIPIRPDMIFSTVLPSGKEIEIGNGEIKKPTVPKYIVNEVRVRVLETAKRQLHLRIKDSSSPNKLITYGVLIHGFSFEIYIVRHINGYYQFEKISWGQLPRFDKVDETLVHTLRSLLMLKRSMQMSVADVDTAPVSYVVAFYTELIEIAPTTQQRDDQGERAPLEFCCHNRKSLNGGIIYIINFWEAKSIMLYN